MSVKQCVQVSVLAVLTTAGASVAMAQITIPTVTVGDPGNAADYRVMSDGTSGYGAVSYTYNIGTYEVTAGQYTAFLNAVAAADTNDLYNTNMAGLFTGITRSGSSGSYAYNVGAAFVNRPVTYVSVWDAMRFANWLHHGQPIGSQNNSTTEDGAYTLTSVGISGNAVTRNAGWQWAVSNESEWHKAAYYKGGGTHAGYWLYPTGSDTAPGNNLADPSGNNANYRTGNGYDPIDSPYYTTLVGEFQHSASPYGTFDQGGNVWEWNDSIVGDHNRGGRGGFFYSDSPHLRASFRINNLPILEDAFIGFRVSAVPGPPSVALLVVGGLVVTRRRRGGE